LLYTDTTDRSPTILHPHFKEYLHSTHGSLQESNHIYINHGFALCQALKNLKIIEMGLGTGLNAFLSAIQATEYGQSVNYTALELFPLPSDLMNDFWGTLFLRFPALSQYEDIQKKIMECPWNKASEVTTHFSLTKLNSNFLDFRPVEKFDLCYYDAFDPEAQPELWDADAFLHLSKLLQTNGHAVTYCCKGSVQRNLKEAGFAVKKMPGPIGKREFIVATKI
jgi:tRNA U34 5-methylaminomethyl-2-thiouridine-forming methyltransferase MnmC